jgi:uncharacterized protein YgbK (DUF1537 family)
MSSPLSKVTGDGVTWEALSRVLPPVRQEPHARRRIRQRVRASGTTIVVIDDDPTGTQTVHDVPVFFTWSRRALAPAFREEEPLLFISTNSRSLDARTAGITARRVGRSSVSAARRAGRGITLISRSDSTLRGHYPREVTELARGLGAAPDATLLVPAFFEGGRYTAGDVHLVSQEGRLVPAGDTEFARDPVFGFRNSDLRLWVEEKTAGAVKSESVLSVTMEMIRTGGPDEVARFLAAAPRGATIIVNACADEDLEVVVLGMLDAEEAGRKFLCRTAASFVKVRAGIEDRPLLSAAEMGAGSGPVLVVVGSYVRKTTRQLDALLSGGGIEGIEFDVEATRARGSCSRVIDETARRASACMRGGRSAVIYTTRAVHEGADFLGFGAGVMGALCAVVRRLEAAPAAVVAKGGITSLEIARAGLGAHDARVAGQVLPGVPVWRLGTGCRMPGLPYVVFPGNVGDEGSLREVLRRLAPG